MSSPRDTVHAHVQPGSSSSNQPPPSSDKTVVDAGADAVGTPMTDVESPKAPPRIVAIVGVEGCGKSTLARRLRTVLGEDDFTFFDISHWIRETRPAGLDTVRNYDDAELGQLRQLVTTEVQRRCQSSGKVGVVFGHVHLLSENGEQLKPAMTCGDIRAYDQVLYLKVPGNQVAGLRNNDEARQRRQKDAKFLNQWQVKDIGYLGNLCRESGVPHSTVNAFPAASVDLVASRLRDFRVHNEQENLHRVLSHVDEKLGPVAKLAKSIVVIDGDKVLTKCDTRQLFWEALSARRRTSVPPRHLPSGHLPSGQPSQHRPVVSHHSWGSSQSYKTLRHLAGVAESWPQAMFETVCAEVAARVQMQPEFSRLLYRLVGDGSIPAVVFTSGLGQVWEKFLQREDIKLAGKVTIIGAGRVSDRFVVTPEVRASVVDRLRREYRLHVWAFASSESDVPMLKAAGPGAILVSQDEVSETMEKVVQREGLQARRLVLRDHFVGGSQLDGIGLPDGVPEVGHADEGAVGDIFELL